VRELGGRIAIVTNRLQIECDDTAEVLRLNALAFDAVLCRPEGAPTSAPKTPRFEAVAAGQTAASLTPVEILAFVGDNIQDFPNATQALRTQGMAAVQRIRRALVRPAQSDVRQLAVRFD
jgi:predicted secreted acid phosphatase